MTTETQEITPDATAETTAAAAAGNNATGEAGGTSTPASEPKGADGQGEAASASPADKGKQAEPKSTFEALQRVYDESRAKAEKEAGKSANGESPDPEASGEPAKAGAEADKSAAPADDLLGRVPDAEWKSTPRKTRERIEAFRERVKALDGTVQELAPRAKVADQLGGYLQRTGMTVEHANSALALYAAVLHDPAKAKAALAPLVEYVDRQLGEIMPDDIRQRVDAGEISEAAGKELARTRMEAARSGARVQQHAEQTQRVNEEGKRREEVSRRAQEVTQGVSTWEASWQATDPDYSKKAPHVIKRLTRVLEAEAKSGVIRTQQEAVALAKEIRAEVEKDLAELAPRPREQRVVTGGNQPVAAPPPKSSLEAVNRAYEEMRRRNAA